MTQRASALRRLLGFTATTGLTSAIGVVMLPVVIQQAGPYTWGVLAATQSAATLFGVAVAFGWGTTGAGEIALADPARRPQMYADSVVSRCYLLVLTYPAMVAVMALLNTDHVSLVAVGSLAYLLPYLGPSWYFVGESRPGRTFRLELIPAVLGAAACLSVITVTGDVVLATAALIPFSLASIIVSSVVITRDASGPVDFDWSPRPAVRRLRRQRHAVTTAATSALYVSTPLLLLNALSPGAMPLYALGDRLFRFALMAFAPVLQFLQGWLPEDGQEGLDHRIKIAMRWTPAVSVAGGVCILALGPWAGAVLSAGEIDFDWAIAAPFALVLVVVSLSQVLGLAVLVHLGRSRDLAASTVVGAACGVPMLVIGILAASAHGAAWALAISEVVVLAYQCVVVGRELQSRSRSRARSAA